MLTVAPSPKIFVPSTKSILDSEPKISKKQKQHLISKIKAQLVAQDAVIIAHYYVDAEIQQLAEQTGGFVADSLEMARFGRDHKCKKLVVVGVKFMGETAKILNPEKTVVMPTLDAECSLDLGCEYQQFKDFCEQYPDRKIVVYSNTSARVKAIADFVVTSGIAVKLINKLKSDGEKIIWAPDKHLGSYLQKTTGADMILWNASCVVHDEFRLKALQELLLSYPQAAVLAHPESPDAILKIADVVGSTTQLIKAAQKLPQKELIVATDKGIFYKMRQVAPDKKLISAPTFGVGATCVSCAHCPWMAMNNLQNLLSTLEDDTKLIIIDENVRKQALKSTEKIFNFLG